VQLEYKVEGIFLPQLGLWLDPWAPVEAAWLSHAHSDHAREVHGWVAGTAETLSLYRERWPDSAGRQAAQRAGFGEPFEWRGAKLTAFPAGHILGAAQLLIEFQGERLVYTGDIKLRPPMCGRTTVPVPCDHLIIESTFGLPVFHFLGREEAAERIISFARECLEARVTPAFLGYPLGRGQEIAHVLCQAGIPTAVHGAIARYIPYYEAAGYGFPNWMPYEPGRLDGRALVVVPGMRNVLEASGKTRIALVSGWAMFDCARTRSGAEELIPYSDHGDFDELLQLVSATGARQIDVVHGYTEPFAGLLRERGLDARARGRTATVATAEEAEG